MNWEQIIALIVAVGGSSGITALLTTLFQKKKYRAEAEKIFAEAEAMHQKNEQTAMEYIKNTLIEITDKLKDDINDLREANDKLKQSNEELRESNRILEQRVDVLNKKIIALMNWIMGDDHRYRTWLETRLHEIDPSIEFPDLTDPPNVFDDDFNGQ